MFRETTINEIACSQARADAASSFVMDEDSFRAFYQRTARGLWAYLTRVTGDRELAQDLLQEAFYRFLRASAAYESEEHRRHSLYRIATNLACDARRRTLRHADAGLTGNEIERLPSTEDASSTERKADFARAMTRLKPRERAILWMAYAEGASHREIAEVLGLRAASLKPMLFRARRKLAGLLGRGPTGGQR